MIILCFKPTDLLSLFKYCVPNPQTCCIHSYWSQQDAFPQLEKARKMVKFYFSEYICEQSLARRSAIRQCNIQLPALSLNTTGLVNV